MKEIQIYNLSLSVRCITYRIGIFPSIPFIKYHKEDRYHKPYLGLSVRYRKGELKLTFISTPFITLKRKISFSINVFSPLLLPDTKENIISKHRAGEAFTMCRLLVGCSDQENTIELEVRFQDSC